MPTIDQHYRFGETHDHDYKRTPFIGMIRYYEQGLAPDHPHREGWDNDALVLTAPEGFWAVDISDLRERDLWVASGAFLRIGSTLQPEKLSLRAGRDHQSLLDFIVTSVERAAGLKVEADPDATVISLRQV